MQNPFNNWTDENVAQGFSVRKESISVMTMNSDGILKIEILKESVLKPEAVRVIEFSYEVEDDFIVIATINAEVKYKITKGSYKIRVQLYKENEETDRCYISFLKPVDGENLPRYIRYDDEITRATDFELNSSSAQ